MPGMIRFAGDSFLLHCESGFRFHYRKGEGLVVHRPSGADPAEEVLWQNGSCYAAVASMHGFFPIHASAVACGEQVYAFTGPAGAGKSTLVAELGRLGLPLFCDDTLILDLSGAKPRCLPGHKRLKLHPDALARTGAASEGKVLADWTKHYASPASGTVDRILPLAELCFLEIGTPARIEPIRGAERLTRLEDEHYTAGIFAIAGRQDRAERFAMLTRLATNLEMSCFVRPFDNSRFASDVALIAAHLGETAGANR